MQVLTLVLVGPRGLPSLASYEVLEHLRDIASGLTLQVIRLPMRAGSSLLKYGVQDTQTDSPPDMRIDTLGQGQSHICTERTGTPSGKFLSTTYTAASAQGPACSLFSRGFMGWGWGGTWRAVVESGRSRAWASRSKRAHWRDTCKLASYRTFFNARGLLAGGLRKALLSEKGKQCKR
eukprot:1008362-Pelagomonas_calceolata.AAC.1